MLTPRALLLVALEAALLPSPFVVLLALALLDAVAPSGPAVAVSVAVELLAEHPARAATATNESRVRTGIGILRSKDDMTDL